MKKIPSNIRREINKMAHERGILFEQAERTRLVLLAEAGQLPDYLPTMAEAFPDALTMAEAFPDALTMAELLEIVDGA